KTELVNPLANQNMMTNEKQAKRQQTEKTQNNATQTKDKTVTKNGRPFSFKTQPFRQSGQQPSP
ncbi:hypothetical protein BaRGS_00027666, partial [Batillaria attramentaria]